jgi:polyphosphate kinase
METITPYVHRDISWLEFNYRVLQEAKDPTVPLLEKLKFLAIYSSNLDEFFRVRVANHRNLLRIGKKTRRDLGFEPKALLRQILSIVSDQKAEFSHIFFTQILPKLAKEGIHLIRRQEMNMEQKEFIENYFTENMLPYVQPVLLNKQKIKPFLTNGALYLALNLEDLKTKEKRLAIVKVPSDELKRFIELPNDNDQEHVIIMIDDVVRHCISWIFPGYEIIESYSIKLTRDAELYIDDEFSGDLLSKIKNSIKKRQIGPASRLVYDKSMPQDFLKALLKIFDLDDYDLLPEGRYHNNSDFFKFPSFGRKYLTETPLTPISVDELEDPEKIFHALEQKDHLIHPPYHSYQSVVNFFEAAAMDPDVTHIKIVQYRVASESRIMDALIKAASLGKQVFAFIEVKARFDEEANLQWGERLEAAGVKVHYSIPGIKVHAKIATVIKQTNQGQKIYSYLSTGNFHEKTAHVYSDFGMFTADPRLTQDAIKLFNFLESMDRTGIQFDHLKVGQFNMTTDLIACIEQEIVNAKKGNKAKIFLKMNSLQDPTMIDLLYKASQAGVKVKMIIRGICSLVPKADMFSENIEAYSIVDRFLEHSRVFIFHNSGNPKYFMSSADFMYRNLYKRIEVVFPIYDDIIKSHLQNLMDLQLKDNVKARSLNYNETNVYRREKDKLQIRSQMETYAYIKRNEK